MQDDFDREVDEWFDDLEGQLAPAGRITPHDDDGPGSAGRPVLSHPSTLAPHRSSVPGLRRGLAPQPVPESEPDPEMVGLVRREVQLADHRRELVRTEALVAVMKELATEIRSVKRDVDQIKAIIGKLRRLAEAKKHMASAATMRTVHPSG